MPGVERIYVACDVSNLWHSCRLQYGKRVRIDFDVLSKLVPSLSKSEVQQKLVAYLVSNPKDNHHVLSQALVGYGFCIRERFLAYNKYNSIRTNWDVGITIDAIHNLDEYDTFVLMSGDGDFSELLEYLKGYGKRTVVMAFGKTTSNDLRKAADSVIPLRESVTHRLD